MLRRLAIVIYWIGFVIGAIFLLLDLGIVLQMLGLMTPDDTETNLRALMAIFTVTGLFSWGVGWIIRYIVTGAKGISPMAKGRDDVVGDAPNGGGTDI